MTIIEVFLGDDEDIEDWLDKLEDAILAKHGDVSDAWKLAMLRNSIGSKNLPIIKQLQKNLSGENMLIFAQVRTAVIDHFRPRSNTVV